MEYMYVNNILFVHGSNLNYKQKYIIYIKTKSEWLRGHWINPRGQKVNKKNISATQNYVSSK